MSPLATVLAAQHDHDLVGDPFDRAEVMGDEHVGDAEFVLQALEQAQDFFADQLIERGRHLVADDEIRLGGERPRDRNPLLLAAGQFGGLPVDEMLRQIHLPEQAPGRAPELPRASA